MLATAATPPRDLTNYLVEPKWDGVRVIVTVHRGRVHLASRNGRNVSSHYPELAGLADALGGRSAVLDGEVVTLDEGGRTSFQRLQRRMHVTDPPPEVVVAVPVAAMLFDLLWLDGQLLLGLAQRERRRRLDDLALHGTSWRPTPLVPSAPVADLLRAGREVGLEGYVLKRSDAAYLPGRRSSAWIKLKCTSDRDLVVGGWTPGRGARMGAIGSLAVGIYPQHEPKAAAEKRLRYMGQVGSGLTQDWIRQLTSIAERLAIDESPFVEQLRGVHFLQPLLIAHVGYSEVTEGGTLRHPTLQGFRTDLEPAELVADEALQRVFNNRDPTVRMSI